MGLDFVAVDVETANAFRGSVCQVGLVSVRNGRVVDEWVSMLQPPTGHCWVDVDRGQVHGFTTQLLAQQPGFDSVWPAVLQRLWGQMLVAHNAGFDLSALQEASVEGGFGELDVDYVCSLVLARRHLELPTHTLDAVAAECGVRLEHHHDALADARAAAEITLALAARVDAHSVTELLAASGVSLGHSGGGLTRPCRAISTQPVVRVDVEPRLF